MRKSVIIMAVGVLALTACAPTQVAEDVQGQVETAVALTVAAQGQIATSVALTTAAQASPAAPTTTSTPTSTPVSTVPTFTPIIPTITPIPTNTPSGSSSGGVSSQADYACDIIRARPFDDTEFRRGEEFDIKWTIVNTGTKTWYQGFDVKYVTGPNMTTTGVTRVELPEMKPKAQYQIVFDAKAPTTRGTHIMVWLVETAVCHPYVRIVVK